MMSQPRILAPAETEAALALEVNVWAAFFLGMVRGQGGPAGNGLEKDSH